MGEIVGFGALNLDLIFEVEDFKSISTEGFQLGPGKEVCGSMEDFQSIIEQLNRWGTLRSRSGGGSAANTIFALAQMGFSTRFIGKVGEDEEGDFLLKKLRPVQTDWIRRGQKSGVCLVILDRHQDRFLFVLGNANSTLTSDEIDVEALKTISWIHLTSFIGESPFEAQKFLLSHLPPSVKVSFDPGEIYAKKGLEEILPLLERCDLLFITEREMGLLSPSMKLLSTTKDREESLGPELSCQEFERQARWLMEMGPSILVCKRGSRGSHIFTKTEEFEVPAIPTEVVDNTGAGDVYNAGFLAGLFLERSLQECALFATTVASRSVRGYGRQCYPTQRDLEEFFQITSVC